MTDMLNGKAAWDWSQVVQTSFEATKHTGTVEFAHGTYHRVVY